MGILRLLLAISVVLGHLDSRFRLISPPLAVQSFYIISGFYMSLILNEKYINANNSYKLFITNRLLKLYPIYYVVLFLIIIVSCFYIFFSGHADGSTSLAYYIKYYNTMGLGSLIFLFFTNIFIFFQDAVMFLGLNTKNGHLFFTTDFKLTKPGLYNFLFIPQAWSISLELMFYLIAPFIVRRNIKVIAALILVSLSVRVFLVLHGLKEDPWNYRFFPNELVFFLLGNVAYKVYTKIKNMPINKWIPISFFLIIVLFTLIYALIPGHIKHYFYTLLFFSFLPFIFLATKKWKTDSYIGELSYPIYICHLFIAAIISHVFVGYDKEILNIFIIIAILIFSYVLNELIVKKIERFRQNRVKTPKDGKLYKAIVTK
ncbi:acyltransferase [Mucilaginibacter sp. UR6-11]|uniref:acyltransferase family protein n=1 Tax=Mucilaginibacter sp. UR6-11 TaxID=1435644 RepID=UPI001E543CAA|nr:acyltransferase [Mucilaginibacter sp. UR6-11]MCC8423971.1 acyltransferase [Mucilaginibacter sp. UR6-11]